MADVALYRKWRPAAFDEVVGQEHVVRTIQNALASDRISHAYLFSGPRGTGKTTTARLVAKALNCTAADPRLRPCNTCPNCAAVNAGRFLDLIEIDAASNNGVDNIRDLRDKINYSPIEGRYRVYIVDEVHMLSPGAYNALLKTLEEPPAHAIFILATTELHKVPLTVASRCQKHAFRRIPAAEVVHRLQAIVKDEGLQVEPAVLEILARQATGSLRDAISLLDHLVVAPGQLVTLAGALAVLGTAGGQAVQSLADAIAGDDSAAGLDLINDVVDGGTDARQFARQMVEYLRGLLLIRLGNAALVEATVGPETRQIMQAQARRLEPARLLAAIKAFNSAAEVRTGWISQLPLELAFVESLRPAPPAPAPLPAASAASAAPRPIKETPPPAVQGAPAVQSAPAVQGAHAAPAAPAGPPPAAIHLGALLAQWKQVVAASKSHHPNLPPLLEKCNPISVDGDVVTLGFQNDILLSKANDAERRTGIEKALSRVFGLPLKVKCVVNSNEVALPADVDSNGVAAEGVKLGGKLRPH